MVYVCMPRLSSLLQGLTALLRARLVHVRVTEYDRATSNYLEPLHARKVARAVERQLKPIARIERPCSLIRALPQTANQLKVKLGIGVLWWWVIVVRVAGCVELGYLAGATYVHVCVTGYDSTVLRLNTSNPYTRGR